jgi:hypothetical protein
MRMNALLMVANSWTQLIGKRRTTAKARKGMKTITLPIWTTDDTVRYDNDR